MSIKDLERITQILENSPDECADSTSEDCIITDNINVINAKIEDELKYFEIENELFDLDEDLFILDDDDEEKFKFDLFENPTEKDIILLLEEVNVTQTFSSRLNSHINKFIEKKRSVKKSDIYRATGLLDSNISKVVNGKVQASKKVAFAFSLALELNLNQTIELLSLAGHAFANNQILDVVVKKFIEKGVYDIDRVNICLEKIYGKDKSKSNKNNKYLFPNYKDNDDDDK